MKRIAIAMAFAAAALAETPKLYIEPRAKTVTTGIGMAPVAGMAVGSATSSERRSDLAIASAVLKRCPTAVAITTNPEAAQFHLTLSPGSSILTNPAGDVIATFKAHIVSTAAKDVCTYFEQPR